jgi:NAD-dependent dihydropyrimidine dehydrogenase PreA subunit
VSVTFESMSTRNIIEIEEEKCTGCGLCIPNCPEGALQVIDGKVRLVSDLFCDGLGACIGYCPESAIRVVEREAEPYDERKVMANISRQGANTVRAHLEHLREHGEEGLLAQALAWMTDNNEPVPEGFGKEGPVDHGPEEHHGCPGARAMELQPSAGSAAGAAASTASAALSARPSELANWPVQLHLLSPMAPSFKGRDVLLAADCTAFAMGSFHDRFLKGKVLAIACPKLDQGADVYREKLTALIDHAQINTLTVAIMEVPCCRGLVGLAQEAVARAKRKVPVKSVVIGIKDGAVLSEQWM